MFLCVQELALLEPNVDNGNACPNLYEELCEHFQLIFLLQLISPEYSVGLHTEGARSRYTTLNSVTRWMTLGTTKPALDSGTQ
jgi:hypothetical protein